MRDAHTDNEVLEAFMQADGNYTVAAKILGISRHSLFNRTNNSPFLKEGRKQAIASLIDSAEDKLVAMVVRGKDIHGSPVDTQLHFKALQYFLTSKGKKRGYEGGGHRRPDGESREDKERQMHFFMDRLSEAIERGGPEVVNGEVVGHD